MKKYIINLLIDLLYIIVSLIFSWIAYFMLDTVVNLTLKPVILINEKTYKQIIAIFSMILFSLILVYFKQLLKNAIKSSAWKREDVSILILLIFIASINAFSILPLTVLFKPIFMLNGIMNNELVAHLLSIAVISTTYYTYLFVCRKGLKMRLIYGIICP